MVLIVVYLIGGLLLSDVTAESCPCNNRTPFDTSAKLTCSNMLQYRTSISTRSVSQCHRVTTSGYECQVPPYNSNNDQSILHSEGNGYKFYRIFQPGYYNNECYSNSLFCVYNVKCSPHQILYYHFTAHDIENPEPTGSCLDVLTINRHLYPVLPTCGQVGINGATYGQYNVMQDGYDIGSMSATFRSNKKCSATGYFIWVGCADVSNDIPGFPITSSNTGFINVPLRGNFSYVGTTLVVRACMGRPLYYSNVRLLRVRYDGSSRIHSYRLPRRKLFHGEGKLYVRCRSRKHCVAYYKFIGVPYKHRLNRSERKKVAMLLGASVDRFNGKGDYSTTFKNRTLVTESINQIIGLERNPSQGAQSYVSTEGIRTTNLKALAYELCRSSKPIVRSVGKFYLEKVH